MITIERIKLEMIEAHARGDTVRVLLCKQAIGKRPEDANPEKREEVSARILAEEVARVNAAHAQACDAIRQRQVHFASADLHIAAGYLSRTGRDEFPAWICEHHMKLCHEVDALRESLTRELAACSRESGLPLDATINARRRETVTCGDAAAAQVRS